MGSFLRSLRHAFVTLFGGLGAFTTMLALGLGLAGGEFILTPLGWAGVSVILLCAALVVLQRKHDVLSAANPPRDVRLTEALGFIVYGQWTAERQAGTLDRFAPALEQVREHALNGRLKSWGAATPNVTPDPLPPEYWRYWQIDWLSFLEKRITVEHRLVFANIPANLADQIYEPSFNKDQIRALYPGATFRRLRAFYRVRVSSAARP